MLKGAGELERVRLEGIVVSSSPIRQRVISE